MIHLIEYEDQYAADFRRLNLQWLEEYNLLESHDLLVLDNPRGNVLDQGGYIWLALSVADDEVTAEPDGQATVPSRVSDDNFNQTTAPSPISADNDNQAPVAPRGSAIGQVFPTSPRAPQVVGTAALVHEHDNVYELAKMSVAPDFRGQGISKLLIEQCLRKAKDIGVGKLILYSNSQLQTAIQLYTKYGFQHVPAVDTPFVTADVKMELLITH